MNGGGAAAAAAAMEMSDRRRCAASPASPFLHALVLCFPTQGHITPMMQLCRRLSRNGVLITFVVTEHTSARSPRSPAAGSRHVYPSVVDDSFDKEIPIQIVSVPDGLPPFHPRDRSFFDQELAMLGMRPSVEGLLRSAAAAFSWQSSGGGGGSVDPPIDFIVADIFVTWSSEVAASFGLPLVAFYTANATSCTVLYNTRFLLSRGILPFTDEMLPEIAVDCIPGAPPLLPSEFPPSMQNRDVKAPRFQFTLRMFERIHDAAALMLNTTDELEPSALAALRKKLPAVYAIGPLFLPASDGEAQPEQPEMTFWQEDEECMGWLDLQPPASVLYVSFGSIAEANEAQMRELAAGIEASRQRFLWVVRRDALKGGGDAIRALPEGFSDRTSDRGRIVSWAAQMRVLAHPAVGGFLTHCGWNSILEALTVGGDASAGVPMLCWPNNADQMVNRRQIVSEWGAGLELRRRPAAAETNDAIVLRDEVEEVVRRLMESEEGSACRERAADLGRMLRKAVKPGGSSAANLKEFLRHVGNVVAGGGGAGDAASGG